MFSSRKRPICECLTERECVFYSLSHIVGLVPKISVFLCDIIIIQRIWESTSINFYKSDLIKREREICCIFNIQQQQHENVSRRMRCFLGCRSGMRVSWESGGVRGGRESWVVAKKGTLGKVLEWDDDIMIMLSGDIRNIKLNKIFML